MTTGSRGVHVVVPLKKKDSFDDVRDFAKEIADYLVELYPKKLTVKMRKSERGKKVFVDYLRNAWSSTAVAPYAVRAKESAPIATPIRWKELSGLSSAQKYTIKNIKARISKTGDIWKDIEKKAVSLSQARKAFENLQKNKEKKQ